VLQWFGFFFFSFFCFQLLFLLFLKCFSKTIDCARKRYFASDRVWHLRLQSHLDRICRIFNHLHANKRVQYTALHSLFSLCRDRRDNNNKGDKKRNKSHSLCHKCLRTCLQKYCAQQSTKTTIVSIARRPSHSTLSLAQHVPMRVAFTRMPSKS
jgi:hypothetical protein